MATVIVTITETLERIITIQDASSVDDALESVQDEYNKEDIILDANDFSGVVFSTEVVKNTFLPTRRKCEC